MAQSGVIPPIYRTVRQPRKDLDNASRLDMVNEKKSYCGSIIAAIVLVIIVIVVLAVVLTRPKASTTYTTASSVYFSVFWSFDNTTTDWYGVYNGQLVNNANYSGTTSTIPYIGQGQALSLAASASQSFRVTTYLNLSYTSFTIEAWIYPMVVTGDNGIFGQCYCSSCSNQCLYLLVRGTRLYAGFTLNDLSGTTVLTVNTWYHVTFVYDYVAQQQLLYLNGVLESSRSNSATYQGGNATTTIGMTQPFPTTNYFTGFIDNLKIVTRAKSASEVLTAASLIAYYSFDFPNSTADGGPNGLNGSANNTAIVSGRVNQAMRFIGSASFFQAYGFYQAGFGVNYNKPFSIAMWINPASTSSCVYVQQSTLATGGSCFNMLGIWSYTGRTAQLVAQGYAWPAIYGPFITVNSWMHVAWTFSLANGYILYVNGNYYGTTGYYSYTGTSGAITWLQLGYVFSCSSAYISNAAYQGMLDEIYIYNREITSSEVAALASV